MIHINVYHIYGYSFTGSFPVQVIIKRAFLITQLVKNLPAMQETLV